MNIHLLCKRLNDRFFYIFKGKDWKYDEQDGGRGSRGTILRVESNGKVVVCNTQYCTCTK